MRTIWSGCSATLRRSFGLSRDLALHAAGASSFQKRLHFVDGGAVEIAQDGMLEAACGYREFDCFLVGREHLQAVNQAGGEAVASAHSIDDVGDFVLTADEKFLPV